MKDVADVEIVVAPPFTALHAVAEAARNSNIGVAAQDLYWEREGAFTGEISPPMIKEAGAEYAIVGHSERRRLFGETDATVNRKAMAAIGAGLTPIVCIGETLEERERDETLAVLDRQIKDGLDGLTAEQVGELVLAYEPVWAIGTGRNGDRGAGRRSARAHSRRGCASGSAPTRPNAATSSTAAASSRTTSASSSREPDVDGALVGGASLDVRGFAEIVDAQPARCGIIGGFRTNS